MNLVHEKLYRSDSLASIDFHEYLHSLISHLRTSFGTARIRCDIAAEGVRMPLDLAVPCGMIINELVTNALKYAFPEDRPQPEDVDCRIHVALCRDNDTCTLSVTDNGIGLPADFDWSTAKTVGLLLVRMLGQHQLGGRYEVDRRHGTSFTLTFKPRNGNHAHA
jgi:two-component sensor histidine kinase